MTATLGTRRRPKARGKRKKKPSARPVRREWLPEDGITDGIAIEIVVNGLRPNTPPNLTEMEAAIAVELMARAGVPHTTIASRLGISQQHAGKWANAARKGELFDMIRRSKP
jgi:hypothetical protein